MGCVAVIQMVSTNQVEDNLKLIERYLKEASEKGVELVVLPENFAFVGHAEKDKLRVSEDYKNGPIQAFVSKLAKVYSLWIVAGTLSIKSLGSRVFASSIVFDSKGLACARYDKIHLFDVSVTQKERYQESEYVEAGKNPVVVNTPVGCVGLSVCYDLRFPELYHKLAQKGADILVVPSAFTEVTGHAHWKTLLKARAIENLCYVLASNQGGEHANGRCTYGHSMIIDAWGKTLCSIKKGSGMLIETIELDYIKKLRAQFPTPSHHVL